MTILCKHCDLPAEDHHDFAPQMPEGCVCDPFVWFGEVTPICTKYEDEDGECVTCSHEKGCHK